VFLNYAQYLYNNIPHQKKSRNFEAIKLKGHKGRIKSQKKAKKEKKELVSC